MQKKKRRKLKERTDKEEKQKEVRKSKAADRSGDKRRARRIYSTTLHPDYDNKQ